MNTINPLSVTFYKTPSGGSPVEKWLSSLSGKDSDIMDERIITVSANPKIGMPYCRSITGRQGLWEIRGNLSNGTKGRVLFCVFEGDMVLLEGFVKKTRQTPNSKLDLAERRMRSLQTL